MLSKRDGLNLWFDVIKVLFLTKMKIFVRKCVWTGFFHQWDILQVLFDWCPGRLFLSLPLKQCVGPRGTNGLHGSECVAQMDCRDFYLKLLKIIQIRGMGGIFGNPWLLFRPSLLEFVWVLPSIPLIPTSCLLGSWEYVYMNDFLSNYNQSTVNLPVKVI